MRITKILIPLGLVLGFAACGPVESLNSLYTTDDATFDPALLGTWVGDGDNKLELTFRQSGYDVYKVLVRDPDGKEGDLRLVAHLSQLGDFRFLDVSLEEPYAQAGSHKLRLVRSESKTGFEPSLLKLEDLLYAELIPSKPGAQGASDGDSYELRLLQASWFFKVAVDGDTLRLAYVDSDWVEQLPDEQKAAIGYEDVGDGVLTGPTEELRKFVLEHVEDEEAFSETLEWHRQK
jgi:hypothetical protein